MKHDEGGGSESKLPWWSCSSRPRGGCHHARLSSKVMRCSGLGAHACQLGLHFMADATRCQWRSWGLGCAGAHPRVRHVPHGALQVATGLSNPLQRRHTWTWQSAPSCASGISHPILGAWRMLSHRALAVCAAIPAECLPRSPTALFAGKPCGHSPAQNQRPEKGTSPRCMLPRVRCQGSLSSPQLLAWHARA